jgi:methylated-DNA-[protein]-cysteine S-methyltransferase
MMQTDYDAILHIPMPGARVGLGLATYNNHLTGVDFLWQGFKEQAPKSGFAAEVAEQIMGYFVNPNFRFSIPIALSGTTYQRQVWQKLQCIDVGMRQTYGQLAKQLHSGARAVGSACRRNPIPIIVPCHRVVSVSGMGGFGGEKQGIPLQLKQWLLQHESI